MKTLIVLIAFFMLCVTAMMASAFWTVSSYRATMRGVEVPCGIFIHCAMLACIFVLIAVIIDKPRTARVR